VFGIFNQVVDGKILPNLADYRSSRVVALPVVRVVVAVEQFDSLFSVVFPAQEANEKFLQIGIFHPAVNQLLNFTD
jgi:hypothetical protein